MIYKHMIESLEKYSFIDKIELTKNFYIRIYYKINGKEKHKSISRRASGTQLQEFIKNINAEADTPPPPKFVDDLPIEVI